MDFGKVPSDSGIFRSTGELREFLLGLNGPYGKGEKGPKGWPHPSPWTSPNWTREGGRPLPSPSPFPSPTPTRKGGVLLPVGVGLPPWRALLLGRPPPPLLLYIRGQGGTPKTHKLIYGSFLSRVRCPPPPYSTSVISLRCLGEALHRYNIIIITTLSC